MKKSLGCVLSIGLWCSEVCALSGNLVARDDPLSIESSATNPTSTSSSAAAGTSGTNPALIFDLEIYEFTACGSANITWLYSGPDSPLSLTVTNIGVNTTAPPPSSSSTVTPITDLVKRSIPTQLAGQQANGALTVVQLICDSTDPGNGQTTYTWNPVNVTEGWYQIWATMDAYPNFAAMLQSPVYIAGTDTSCLSGGGSASTTSLTITPISTSTSPTPSSSTTDIAVTGAATKVNAGAVAGGVVGGLAVVAAVLFAYIYFVCVPSRRRRSGSPRGGTSSRGFTMGKWGALGSFDSAHASPKTKKAKPYNNQRPMIGLRSTGDRQHSHGESVGPILTAGSAEDYNPYEKQGIITVGYSPPHTGPMRQSYSSDLYGAGYTRPLSTIQSFPESPRPSTTDLDNVSRRASLGTPSPVPPFSADSKRTRKTPRKPVPSYTPDPLDTPMPSTESGPSTSSPAPSSGNASPTGSVEAVHTLIHKGSFGDGRPVHVLMPDMPPPQQY